MLMSIGVLIMVLISLELNKSENIQKQLLALQLYQTGLSLIKWGMPFWIIQTYISICLK